MKTSCCRSSLRATTTRVRSHATGWRVSALRIGSPTIRGSSRVASSNLDQATGGEVAELMFRLNRENSTTLILVTHDAALATRCTRRLSLAAGRLVGDERVG